MITQTVTEVNRKNNMLEIMLEDASRLQKYNLAKEKSLVEGKFWSLYLKSWSFVLPQKPLERLVSHYLSTSFPKINSAVFTGCREKVAIQKTCTLNLKGL